MWRQLLRSADLFTVSQAAGALSECSIRNDSNKTLVSAAGAIPLLVTMLQASLSPAVSVRLESSPTPQCPNSHVSPPRQGPPIISTLENQQAHQGAGVSRVLGPEMESLP